MDDPRASDGAYRTLFESIPYPALVFDRKTLSFLEVNSAALRFYGWSRAEFLGMTAKDIRPPDEVPLLIGKLAEEQTAETRFIGVVRHWNKDHAILHVEVTISMVGFHGHPACLAVIHDVTGSKQGEEMIARERSLLRTLVDLLPDCIYLKDLDSRFLLANDAVAKVMGASSASELIGRTDSDFYPPKLAAAFREDERRVFRSGQPVINKEETRQDPNGQTLHLLTTKVPLKDEQGNAIGLVGIGRDITGRKRMDAELKRLNSTLERRVAERTEQLREREDRLHAILNTVGDAILTIDRHGRIIGINPATERIFGYKEAELSGRNAALLVPSGFGKEMDGGLTDLLHTEVVRILGTTREMQGHRKDGMVFPVDLSLSEVDDSRIYTCVIRDITRRKELEVEVLRITEAERQRVAADLHDGICQELVGIAFMLTAARRDLPKSDPLSHKLRLIAQAIIDAANHTRQVARGMSPVVADGGGLMHALRRLATTTAHSRRIRSRFECPVPVTFEGPMIANELYRIAQEAIHNAIRHGEAGQITIRLSEQDGEVCLAILDNGRGCGGISQESPGMGLRVMSYRASLIGAELTIQPRKRGGTAVVCCVQKPAD